MTFNKNKLMKKQKQPVLKPARARTRLCLLMGLALSGTALASDALNEASAISPLVAHSLLMDIERAGNNIVAVGERGHILMSGDEGDNWRQVASPVRVTLTGTYFIDESFGWAVGHDGVVLKTGDGGKTWRKLLDGVRANELMLEHAQARLAAGEEALENAPEEQQEELAAEVEELTYLAEDAEVFADEGPSRPFLDVWFKDRNEGIVVGAFGLMLRTTDGGETWAAWYDHLDNASNFHLNAISPIGDHLYIAAEAGTLYRSGDWGQSWEMLDSPYDGSFFGITGNAQGRLVAYGLRGNAFQSGDWGDSWEVIDTGVDSSFFSGTMLNDGSAVLVGAAGVSVHIDAAGQVIGTDRDAARLPLSKVLESANKGLLVAGLNGVHRTAVTEGKTQ